MGYRHLIQNGILKCNSQKVLYLLKRRICVEAHYVDKAKTKFRETFDNCKRSLRSCRKKHKVSQQHFHEHYGQHSHNGIDDWQFTLNKQCETHEQLKENENVGNAGLRSFTFMGLMKRQTFILSHLS